MKIDDMMGAEMALPVDAADAALAGRVWRPDVGGPAVVAYRDGKLVDISRHAPTMADLAERRDAASVVRSADGDVIGALGDVLANTPEAKRDETRPWLLAPNDLQAIKAAGVTFARSMLERVIEEQAKGSPEKAEGIRQAVNAQLGGDLRTLKPGSPAALELKKALIAAGAWSQYLEVGIGEDAEIFTKAQPMSAVGHLMQAGLHPRSTWNNPEPEVVLVIASDGKVVGATLGNDVNLRDFEGRSALLLSKAKDNNASAAVGPFIRFFDERFSMADVRKLVVRLSVHGNDGFVLDGMSSMAEIARDPEELAEEMFGGTHQYPDGAVLYLGTMFAPTEDRGAKGMGFTHHVGDIVRVSTDRLGSLVNVMGHSSELAPWTFGTRALMRSLEARGLIGRRA